MAESATASAETAQKAHGQAKKTVTLALAGNPNSGKTTAFNHYTGSRQHVANYPGITVERKIGTLDFGNYHVRMVDLPGTYSLTAYAQDELVARRGLSEDQPDCVIDVVNASALERNLYLAVQIMEMGLPIVIALNMYDEARKQGVDINHQRLSELMGVPVVPTVGRTGEGLKQALAAAMQIAEGRFQIPADSGQASNSSAQPGQGGLSAPGRNHTPQLAASGKVNRAAPLVISYGTDLDKALEELTAMVEDTPVFSGVYPARWIALKYLENDAEIREKTRKANPALASRLEQKVAEVARHLEQTMHTYPEAIIADYRYGYINSLLRQGVITRKSDLQSRMQISDKADKLLTHRLLGPILMLGVIYLMFTITFTVGEIPMGWVEEFFGWLNETVSGLMADGLLKSLIVSGIIDGVGAVLGFAPLILFMFLQIAFLEDSGYMARVAYMLDRVFRAFGLHGYSVMPFIISGGIAGGCAVPGVMAARTLRSPKEKMATILTAPFMTCGAKMPVFLVLAAAFFPGIEARVMMIMTLTGWGFALLVSRIMRSTVLKGESTPFVMELPPYRLPTLFGVLIHTWERVWAYIKKAGTVIVAVTIVIWLGMTFPELPADQTEAYESKIAAAEEAVAPAEEALTALLAAAGIEGLEGMDAMEEDKLSEEIVAAKESYEELQGAVDDLNAEHAAAALEHSVAGRIGRTLETITSPAGFDWRTNIALVGGVGAKEVVIATLGTAYSLGEVDPEEAESLEERLANDPQWNKANAASLMVFVLLYFPCFVTVVVTKQETGSWKWALSSAIFNTLLAFVAAVIVYQVGLLLIA